MKCAYHTVGVLYDTVEVAVTLIKIGVINTSQCHILHQFFMCSIEQVNFVIFSYDIATMVSCCSKVGDEWDLLAMHAVDQWAHYQKHAYCY